MTCKEYKDNPAHFVHAEVQAFSLLKGAQANHLKADTIVFADASPVGLQVGAVPV